MSVYDQQCAREFARIEQKLAKFFIEVKVECPYNLPYTATFFQGMFGPVPNHIMEIFLAAGYRRNGNFLYTMRCRNCQACIPIRLYPQNFSPSRNQKRVRKRNRDVEIIFGPVEPTQENVALCDKFLRQRYPAKSNTGAGYYSDFFSNNIVTTAEIRYQVEDQLIGAAIVDTGPNWMNAVYFYFDPDEAQRSPGTLNILSMIDLCLKMEIDYLYLGYHIEQISAMNYKRNFKPHYLYIDSKWLRFDNNKQ